MFAKFFEFKALVEKDNGSKVKALKSDNSEEYVSNEFKKLCASEGIQWELIAPHNPQQNWVVERKNRSIVQAAWVMLHDEGLSLCLWVKACNTVVYFHNRSPYQILEMSTLEKDLCHKTINAVNTIVLT